jgi:hypothetical protein
LLINVSPSAKFRIRHLDRLSKDHAANVSAAKARIAPQSSDGAAPTPLRSVPATSGATIFVAWRPPDCGAAVGLKRPNSAAGSVAY